MFSETSSYLWYFINIRIILMFNRPIRSSLNTSISYKKLQKFQKEANNRTRLNIQLTYKAFKIMESCSYSEKSLPE